VRAQLAVKFLSEIEECALASIDYLNVSPGYPRRAEGGLEAHRAWKRTYRRWRNHQKPKNCSQAKQVPLSPRTDGEFHSPGFRPSKRWPPSVRRLGEPCKKPQWVMSIFSGQKPRFAYLDTRPAHPHAMGRMAWAWPTPNRVEPCPMSATHMIVGPGRSTTGPAAHSRTACG